LLISERGRNRATGVVGLTPRLHEQPVGDSLTRRAAEEVALPGEHVNRIPPAQEGAREAARLLVLEPDERIALGDLYGNAIAVHGTDTYAGILKLAAVDVLVRDETALA